MEYQRMSQLVLAFAALAMIFLFALTTRFFVTQINKTRELDPEILAQYEVVLDTNKFLELTGKLKH